MCTVLDEVEERGKEIGKEIGMLRALRGLMGTMKCSGEKAMELLGIPEEEKKKYREKLNA